MVTWQQLFKGKIHADMRINNGIDRDKSITKTRLRPGPVGVFLQYGTDRVVVPSIIYIVTRQPYNSSPQCSVDIVHLKAL